MWITFLDRVSANSEKGRGSEWAVRVGQRLHRDSGRVEQPEKWIWYKLSWKRRQLGGVCQTLSRHSLFLAGAARSVLVDYREGLSIRSAGYKLCSVEKMACSWRSWKYSAPCGCSATFSWPLMSLRTRPKTSAWRWLLVACFSSVKNHNVLGPHLFPSFTTHAGKIPLPPLGRSYSEQKNHFAIATCIDLLTNKSI